MDKLTAADPTELGGIAIRGRLGQGGMGTVYFGVTRDGDRVAVKTIRDDLLTRTVVKNRFEREILALGMVQGPRVAPLVAEAEEDETPQWLAAEYVQGLTLAEYVKDKGPLDVILAAALGIQLTEALQEIHEAGIFHRDFKPGNIILGADGPKVIDFGLAALADAEGDITRTGDVIGTPHCMAPEQARTPKDITGKIDVYALGAVLAFATTGHYLYDRPSMPALLFAIANPDTAPDLSGLPAELTPLVENLLHSDPEQRPELADITATLTKILQAHDLTPQEATRKLAAQTYIERDTDPDPADQADTTITRRERMTGSPHAPVPVVESIARNLRQTYARKAAF